MKKKIRNFIKFFIPKPIRALLNKIFLPRRWGKYYAGERDFLQKPEICFQSLEIPKYIKTVLDVGCSNGRNFIPYEGKTLVGTEIVSYDEIKWIKPFKDFYFMKITVEDLTKFIQKNHFDMTNWLVISSGVLMYVSEKEQNKFYQVLKKSGCKNFIFQEYPSNSKIYPKTNFKLDTNDFDQKVFRDFDGEDAMVCYYKIVFN